MNIPTYILYFYAYLLVNGDTFKSDTTLKIKFFTISGTFEFITIKKMRKSTAPYNSCIVRYF